MEPKKRDQRSGYVRGDSRASTNSYHPEVMAERKHSPIAEMGIQSHEHPLLLAGFIQNGCIVGARLTRLTRSRNIMAFDAQLLPQLGTEHLIEIKTQGD